MFIMVVMVCFLGVFSFGSKCGYVCFIFCLMFIFFLYLGLGLSFRYYEFYYWYRFFVDRYWVRGRVGIVSFLVFFFLEKLVFF